MKLVINDGFNRNSYAASDLQGRNLNASCGHPDTITFDEYRYMWERNDVAKAVIGAYADATWARMPELREEQGSDGVESGFESGWRDLSERLGFGDVLNRLDTVSGIGRYGCMLLGYEGDLMAPVKPGAKLEYVRVYSEGSAIVQVDMNETITGYTLGIPNGNASFVHPSRVLHVVDNKLESEVYGEPRLKGVFNRILDCRKVLGCSAEMFWAGAFQGISFEMDSEADIVDKDSLQTEIEKYVSGLSRYMRLQGIQAKVLNTQVANPQAHIDVQLQFISAATRIPIRILTGSERGELSSAQDEGQWRDRVEERRKKFAEPGVLRPLVNKLIEYKTLPKPSGRYEIVWGDSGLSTRREQMETARLVADALRMYVETGLDRMIKPEAFLEGVMKFPSNVVRTFETYKDYEWDGGKMAIAALGRKDTGAAGAGTVEPRKNEVPLKTGSRVKAGK